MGIAGLVPWLRYKYPLVIKPAIENGDNPLKPNPNFQEFDNMYIDMNGIVHQCSHPEGRTTPITEEEIFQLIFTHIDRLFAIVRPRKLLYFAIDGVAPRAKMNQQRSRRFQSAKEVIKRQKELAIIRKALSSRGVKLPSKNSSFDSNQITPGTPFMVRLAAALRYYIHMRVTTYPAWQKLVVVLSDASVPGEGEHKIIDFIRRQSESENYNPKTSHCIAGPDADLIMLGLATHEADFVILRQEFDMNRPVSCEICSHYGHKAKECSGLSIRGDASKVVVPPTTYIFVRLPELRKYLYNELHVENLPYDFERALDDWVFLCFFVGNDFLPHLPSLEIHENAIDRLIKLYKNVVYKTKGWLTDNGNVSVKRLEMIMEELGKMEDEIFRTRQEREPHSKVNQKRSFSGGDENEPRPKAFKAGGDLEGESWREVACDGKSINSTMNTTISTEDDVESVEPKDTLCLWENGWKDRYYKQKFGTSENDVDFRRKVAWAYTEGLCWIFKYYRQGCASWNWFYPYHYAPFASDFNTISKLKVDWPNSTKPFSPFEQLMAIFPAASRSRVPQAWRSFMTSTESPIYHFYPNEFKVDMNGKKFAGQGIAILPFVDEKLLIKTLKTAYDSLTEEELQRNSVGVDVVFVGRRHQMFNELKNIYEEDKSSETPSWHLIDSNCGIVGEVCYHSASCKAGTTYPSPYPNSNRLRNIPINTCLMLAYRYLNKECNNVA